MSMACALRFVSTLWLVAVLAGCAADRTGLAGTDAATPPVQDAGTLAAHGDHARGRLDASFGEVRVFDRQLSDEELTVLEQHLRCTWVD